MASCLDKWCPHQRHRAREPGSHQLHQHTRLCHSALLRVADQCHYHKQRHRFSAKGDSIPRIEHSCLALSSQQHRSHITECLGGYTSLGMHIVIHVYRSQKLYFCYNIIIYYVYRFMATLKEEAGYPSPTSTGHSFLRMATLIQILSEYSAPFSGEKWTQMCLYPILHPSTSYCKLPLG